MGTCTGMELPYGRDAASIARRLIAERVGGLPQPLLDDAMLLTSELVANAVLHGSPTVVLRVRVDAAGLTVSVQDGGHEVPTDGIAQPDVYGSHGRGLFIVAALATAWGVTPSEPPPGKTVWFRLQS